MAGPRAPLRGCWIRIGRAWSRKRLTSRVRAKMPVTVHIPTPLRGFTAGHARLELDGATVGEILQALVGEHQALRRHLLQEDGRPRNFVNIYLNETDIRYLWQSATPGRPGAAVTILVSIA